MLTETLLDSSPSRQPMLRGRHWLITLAAAVAGFGLAYFALPLVEAPQAKALMVQALLLSVGFFFSALMVVYVHADARYLRLRTWPWMALTFLLNVAGFIAYLVYSAAKTGNWKRATLPIAYMIEVMVIGVMVIVPLVSTEALPKASLSIVVIPPAPSPPPPPPAASSRAAVQHVTVADLEREPAVIPPTIAQFKEKPLPPGPQGVVEGVPGGVPGGRSDGVLNGMIGMNPTPPPPPKPAPHPPQRIRVGGNLEAARLIYAPKPDYPPLARMARIQRTVRLEALIATDGTIKGLKVLSGHPLLLKAALEAVQQWRYQPTLLNGQPVEVETDIDVNFTLQE